MKKTGSVVFIVLFFLLLALPGALQEPLIALHEQICQTLFGQSGNEQVLLGKGEWLFFAETLDDYLHRNRMGEEAVESLTKELGDMSRALRLQGVGMTCLIAPNKNTVYPEWMPNHMLPGAGESDLERVQAALSLEGVGLLDARGLLLTSKEQGPLYHRTDTHWNALGALLVYRGLMEKIAGGEQAEAVYEAYETLRWQDDVAYAGDLSRLRAGGRAESIRVPELAKAYRVLGSMRSLSDMTIRTKSAANDLRVLVLRDSFGNALFPYLANNVGQLTFSRDLRANAEEWAKQGFTHVVIEIAERNLPELSARLAGK